MNPNGMIIHEFDALEEQRNVIKQEGLCLARLTEMNHRQSAAESAVSALGLAPSDAFFVQGLLQPSWEPCLPFPSGYRCAASAASNYTGATLGPQPLDDYTRLMTCPHAGPIKYGDVDGARKFLQLGLGSPTPTNGTVDRDQSRVFVDGRWVDVTSSQADIIEKLTQRKGVLMQGFKLKSTANSNERPDKLIKAMPEAVRNHIIPKRGAGGGYRWVD